MFPVNTILAWIINIYHDYKEINNNYSIASRAYFLQKLDKVIVPSPLLESSSSQKSVLVTTTPISEEANDDDHETSDQVIITEICPRGNNKVIIYFLISW